MSLDERINDLKKPYILGNTIVSYTNSNTVMTVAVDTYPLQLKASMK